MAVKPEDLEDHIRNAHVKFIEECTFFQPLQDSPFVESLKVFLETGKISENLHNLVKQSTENTDEKSTRRRGRKPEKFTALKEITENIQIKSEKVSEGYSEKAALALTATENVVVKTENLEMPAPAKLPPWKKKIKTEPEEPKRSTRTRTRKQDKKETDTRDSDVEIQNATVTTIEVSDDSDAEKKNDVPSDTESEASTRSMRTRKKEVNKEPEPVELPKRVTRTKTRKNKEDENPSVSEEGKKTEEVKNTEKVRETEEVLPQRSTRTKTRGKKDAVKVEQADREDTQEVKSTRTKTKAKNTKRTRDASPDSDNVTETKKSKSQGNEQDDADSTTKTVFEDARTSIDEPGPPKPADATFVKTPERPPLPAMDATVIIEKPKIVNGNQLAKPITNGDPLLTDDESEDEQQNKAQTNGNGKIVQVFSPYDKTPVKNKVKAFEKLAQTCSASKLPRCIVRVQELNESRLVASKGVTPDRSNFAPRVCSTTKAHRGPPGNDSLLSQKSYSSLKASQSEYRERERRRLEKETEAQKKKDAMLAAIVEEKRKRREEKQLKAQQQREMHEREKQRLLDAQQAKEEKHRQAMQEREERAARQREEQERRRLLVKQKALEAQREKEEQKMAAEAAERERQKLEALRLEKIRALQHQKPIYMVTKPPPLPTFDCYDSDDPEYGKEPLRLPSWSKDPHMKMMQYAIMSAGDRIKNTLFCVQAQSVNLTEVFENIDPQKLKRTSSAIWKKPPRFTMMPNLEETRFSEDEEDLEDGD